MKYLEHYAGVLSVGIVPSTHLKILEYKHRLSHQFHSFSSLELCWEAYTLERMEIIIIISYNTSQFPDRSDLRNDCLTTTENGYKKEKGGNVLEDNFLSWMRESAPSNWDEQRKTNNIEGNHSVRRYIAFI